jgi:phage terminase large subunit-like protein
MLGYRPHKWQSEFAQVALELLPDGRLAYDTVVALLPRRGGKTVLGLSAICHRGNAFNDEIGPQMSLSTMQSGIDSRAMFKDTWLPVLNSSDFKGTFREVFQISHEQIRWANGSVHSVRAPKVGAGVGGDLDMWLNDEAWHFDSSDFDSAIWPASGTRPMSQKWILSMAGDLTSSYLADKRDLGRSLCELGANTGTCYIEFSADETDDIDDELTWWATHPALGKTMSIEKMRSFHQEMKRADFAKEFLGIWPTGRSEPVIDGDLWAACTDEHSTMAGELCYAIDSPESQSESSISAAGARADGRMHIELLAADRGLDWVVRFAPAIQARNPGRWAMDSKSGARAILPDLQKAGMAVTLTNLTDACAGAGAFFNAIKNGRLAWLGARKQPQLDASVRGAAKRTIGQTWAWARSPGIDSTPLQSASLAHWTASQPATVTGPINNWNPWDIGKRRKI